MRLILIVLRRLDAYGIDNGLIHFDSTRYKQSGILFLTLMPIRRSYSKLCSEQGSTLPDINIVQTATTQVLLADMVPGFVVTATVAASLVIAHQNVLLETKEARRPRTTARHIKQPRQDKNHHVKQDLWNQRHDHKVNQVQRHPVC